jgi:hypothetical protein
VTNFRKRGSFHKFKQLPTDETAELDRAPPERIIIYHLDIYYRILYTAQRIENPDLELGARKCFFVKMLCPLPMRSLIGAL